MISVAHRVMLSSGWRRLAIAILCGAVGALAMPPFGFLPALVLSLTPAVWLIDGAVEGGRRPLLSTLGTAAQLGWAWGLGYFVAGLWWLGAAFLVEADQFAWALPFGVLGLPALLAFFPAFGFGLARLVWSPGPARIAALAFGLGASEWARGVLFTGFPWNTLGMALGQNLWLMQGASLVGLYGLTVIAVLIAASPAALAGGADEVRRWAPPMSALVALALLAAYGALRLPSAPLSPVTGVKLRIVQPNVPQDQKFSRANGPQIMRRYLALSDRATGPENSGVADVTHLVWPESAFPFLLHKEPWALAQIAALLPPGVTLITGAAREAEDERADAGRRFYNSIQALADDGSIVASYDKAHLVPFGEYFPHFLDALLRRLGLRQFVHVPGGFESGENAALFKVPGLPAVAATICYEAIFPGAVIGRGPRPGLILNVTNDAWFGNTPGPYQHFAQARLRAVEEGLPLVRAANTGISAVIDPYGRVVGQIPLGAEGVLDAALPASIAPPPGTKLRSILFPLLLLSCAAASLLGRRPSRPAPSMSPA